MVKKLKQMGRTGVIAAALAELQHDAVKEATAELKKLYTREKAAKKVLRNVQREIQDYLQELEIDDADDVAIPSVES